MTGGVITINIAPEIHLGPVTLAWHGLTIAIGIGIGGLAAARYARQRGMDTEPLYTIGMILAIAALVGGRLFYLLEHGQVLEPDRWFASTGFTFNGGFIAAAVGIAVYLWRTGRDVAYLDVVAVGLPLGVAIGRIGDVINGEHYGNATDFFLGVVNAHPDSLTPRHDIAYHNGGLYEVILGTLIFAVVWPMRHRLAHRATALMWLVLAMFATGRFFEFFLRDDSEEVALGLNSAQWTSVALLAVAAGGAWWTLGRRARPRGPASTAT